MSTLYSRVWENKILDTLDRRPNKKCDYVLLRSEQVSTYPALLLKYSFQYLVQLVGTALLVLVKSELTAVIRNVEGTSRKVAIPCTPWSSAWTNRVRQDCEACPETRERLEYGLTITILVFASWRLILLLVILTSRKGTQTIALSHMVFIFRKEKLSKATCEYIAVGIVVDNNLNVQEYHLACWHKLSHWSR